MIVKPYVPFIYSCSSQNHLFLGVDISLKNSFQKILEEKPSSETN